MADAARKAFVVTVVAVGVVVFALALWKLKVLVALLFLAFTVAAAMRPGIEWLAQRRVPRPVGVLIHYVVLAVAVGLLLWLAVPRAISQVDQAVQSVPAQRAQLGDAARHSTGIRHDILVGLQNRLSKLPRASTLVRPALHITVTAFEILIGVFFVLAAAAYWIFERDHAMDYICCLLPRDKRKTVQDTWFLIDLKLGSYVRGQGLLILVVGTILSLAFWAIGEPYWLLLGAFAGIVEVVPVIGPIVAGVLAVGVGLTESWGVGIGAGIVVLVQRQLEDYLIAPRILGGAVGLSPLLVIVSVFATGILWAPAVVLAIPMVAVLTTLVDVAVLNRDPSKEDVPTVLFPAKEAES